MGGIHIWERANWQNRREAATMQDAIQACKRAFDHEESGELDKALAAYSEAIRLDPALADAYFFRGTVYAEKSDLDRAVADYTQAIRLNPKDADAYNKRACAYEKKGESVKAAADYSKAEWLTVGRT
jgi:tetratricopeptide (TPR) repeat protein